MKKHVLLIEVIVFAIVLCFVMGRAYDALSYKNLINGGGMETFYDNKVPIDVYILGNSHASCTINNAILWDEYGIPSYTLSSGGQSTNGAYYFLKEGFAKNKPKVVLIESMELGTVLDNTASLYRSALTTKWSLRYPEFILRTSKEKGYTREFTEELLLRMPIVHSRYNELNCSDFIIQQTYGTGYEGSNAQQEITPPERTDRREEIPEISCKYIDDIIELCEKNGVVPIFFHAPYQAREDEMALQNGVKDYLLSKGQIYFGICDEYEKYGIDYSTDFREFSHVNNKGAAKITRFFGEYMSENLNLPDRRGESGYDKWDQHSHYLDMKEDRYYLQDSTDFADYLNRTESLKDKYTIVMMLDGNFRAQEDEAMMSFAGNLGITPDVYEKGGAFVIKNGEVTYCSDGQMAYNHYEELGKSTDLYMRKSEDQEFGKFKLGYFDLSTKCNGITLAVFDESIGCVVDAIYVNVYEEIHIERYEYGENNWVL